LGLVYYGMDQAAMAGALTVAWYQYAVPCDQQLKQIRALVREHQAGTQNAE